jgi:acyl-CoA dehydrogenase
MTSDVQYAHLTDDQRVLLAQAERSGEALAAVAAAGEPGKINRKLLAGLAERGLFGRLFGRAERLQAVDLCLMREGLARHCTEAETALAVQGLGTYPIMRSGTAEVVDEWLPRLSSGEAAAGLALTEPNAGSDAGSLELSAVRDGDTYRLTGEKVFISNAPAADVYTVFARTGGGPRAKGITAFAVPRDSIGLTGESLELISEHPIGRLVFDGVPVPATHVLGEVDGGWEVAMRTFDLFRPSVGAFSVGMAQAALDAAVSYVSRRQQFGRTLHEFQGVTHQLADVATRLQAARLLVHGAASAYDAGAEGMSHLAAMAKLYATETAQTAVDVAIQVCGARALEKGHVLEHLYREVRAPRIYEGTSEIQREIIARQLFRAAQPG